MHAVSCCYCRCVVASGAAALKRLNGNALECERLSTTAAGDATSSFQSAWIQRSASNTGRVLRSHRGVSNVCTSIAVRSHVALYAVRIQFYTSTLPISESLYFVRQELPFFSLYAWFYHLPSNPRVPQRCFFRPMPCSVTQWPFAGFRIYSVRHLYICSLIQLVYFAVVLRLFTCVCRVTLNNESDYRAVAGPSAWDSLPPEIKTASTSVIPIAR